VLFGCIRFAEVPFSSISLTTAYQLAGAPLPNHCLGFFLSNPLYFYFYGYRSSLTITIHATAVKQQWRSKEKFQQVPTHMATKTNVHERIYTKANDTIFSKGNVNFIHDICFCQHVSPKYLASM
jgi:hypothetical protein